MAFIKKPFRRLSEGAEADTYIDLGELSFEGDGGALGEPVEHLVKVAEVYRYEDIADLTTHVYNGNILLIDYTSLASDDLALKRITAELKSAVRDCGGDVAVVGKNVLMATPAGIKIDRAKIKGAFLLRPATPPGRLGRLVRLRGEAFVIRQDEVVARMVRVAHLRAPEQQLDPSFPRAAESQFEDAVREERDVVRDAAPRRIDVRDDVRRHAHRPQEVEEMEQFVPDVLQVSHRDEDVHRVDDDEIDLLALIPSDEKVFQHPQPVPDLLGAFVLDAEARDVDEEVFLVPEAVVAHRPKDRLAALLDGHVDAAATRGAILDQDVQRERRLHRAARSGDCDDAALRHPALERGVEAADVGREAFVSGRRSRRLDGQRGHLLPQPPDFVAQFPQLRVQVLRRLRRLSGLRGPHPLHVHTVRHPVA